MRALNLIECNLRKKEGMGHFQIDHCIAGLEAEAEWELSPVFAALPEAFLKTGLGAVNYHTRGSLLLRFSRNQLMCCAEGRFLTQYVAELP